MLKLASTLCLILVSAPLLAMTACSSTTTSSSEVTDAGPSSTDGSPDTDSGKVAFANDGGTSERGDSSTKPSGDLACAAKASLNDCGLCCNANHMAGYQTLASALIACICRPDSDGGPAPCATECGTTLCLSTPVSPTVACNECAESAASSGGACTAAVGAACGADTDCTAQQTCVLGCQGKS